MTDVDLLIVGAGPAGMAAAVTADRFGLKVILVDEQVSPGGQIWRSVELRTRRDEVLGPSYVEGRVAAAALRKSAAIYYPGARLWQIEPGFRAFVSRGQQSECINAKVVILATGAQERPAPFPGWTLPGVLTVGAAQILLKNAGQVPADPVWIAGSGPLPLLYAVQLLRAGGRIAGYLDTTPPGQWGTALRYLPGAARAPGDILKGLRWMATLRRSGAHIVKHVSSIEAVGDDRIEHLRYSKSGTASTTVDASLLLVHEGVVPNIHPALSLDCEMKWDEAQECFRPHTDKWGETSRPSLFVAGDGAGIGGAKAAELRGRLSALRAVMQIDATEERAATREAQAVFKSLRHALATRPFLDAMFKPRREIFSPPDTTVICRCEETTAGEIRRLATVGRPGPNQLKAATRAGMGPCQGRQCGYTVTQILADCQHRTAADVGFYHIRPPLKPVSLNELASLQMSADD